jgi:replicative DNA helicase
MELFRMEFPSYEVEELSFTPDELIEVATKNILSVAAQDAMGDLSVFQDTEDWEAFTDRAMSLAVLMQNQDRTGSVVDVWDDEGHDVEALLNRNVKFGIGTGIPEIDGQEDFNGFQPGNLVTYLGRAKAGKTSFALLSALDAAMQKYKRIMIVTVEISAASIHDRLDAYEAHVSLSRLVSGKLTDPEKSRVRRTYEDRGQYEPLVYIVEPAEQYTVTDLQGDIDRYQPDYVVIDGFYFMTDRDTGKSGGSWEGHDNLARDIKRVAMRNKITALVTHQVREKQLGSKKGAGIDDGAMMGGTGLIMASDMVIGLDVNEEHIHKITCTRSRTGYLRTVLGTWNWDTCTFEAYENEEDYDPDAE